MAFAINSYQVVWNPEIGNGLIILYPNTHSEGVRLVVRDPLEFMILHRILSTEKPLMYDPRYGIYSGDREPIGG